MGHDRPRRGRRRNQGRLHGRRWPPHLGRWPGDAQGLSAEHPLGLEAQCRRLRPVHAGDGQALQRHLHAQGPVHTAAQGEHVVAVERAELRRGPRAPGDQRLQGPDRADVLPRPRQPGLQRAQEDRPQPRHDPHGRARRRGLRAEPQSQEDRRPARRRRADAPAAVPAPALLRGQQLQAADREHGQGGRLPHHRGGEPEVPHARTPRCSTSAACRSIPTRQNQSPVSKAGDKPDYIHFPDIPAAEAEIDHLNKIYGSGKRYAIYNDEYGYITNPPVPRSSKPTTT